MLMLTVNAVGHSIEYIFYSDVVLIFVLTFQTELNWCSWIEHKIMFFLKIKTAKNLRDHQNPKETTRLRNLKTFRYKNEFLGTKTNF